MGVWPLRRKSATVCTRTLARPEPSLPNSRTGRHVRTFNGATIIAESHPKDSKAERKSSPRKSASGTSFRAKFHSPGSMASGEDQTLHAISACFRQLCIYIYTICNNICICIVWLKISAQEPGRCLPGTTRAEEEGSDDRDRRERLRLRSPTCGRR